MKIVSEKSMSYREKLGLLILNSPDILFFLVLCGFGGAVAGWLFIGVGALFALVPMVGFAVYCWAQRRRNQGDVV